MTGRLGSAWALGCSHGSSFHWAAGQTPSRIWILATDDVVTLSYVTYDVVRQGTVRLYDVVHLTDDVLSYVARTISYVEF